MPFIMNSTDCNVRRPSERWIGCDEHLNASRVLQHVRNTEHPLRRSPVARKNNSAVQPWDVHLIRSHFGSSIGSVSFVGGNRSMLRRGASAKGRAACAAPISLGFHQPVVKFQYFCCGLLCGIQITIVFIFIWLLIQ